MAQFYKGPKADDMSVDIDWEYPGGNGGDYKQVPNSQKTYQIDAFPKVLAAIRASIGDKLLSIAVPGKKGNVSYLQGTAFDADSTQVT